MQSDQTGNNVVRGTFWHKVIDQKFSNPFVLFFLLLFSLLSCFAVYQFGIIGGGGILALIIGLPAIYIITLYPKMGISILIIASFFISYVSEFLPDSVPIGTLLDGITYLLILGLFIKQRKERNWIWFKNPISYIIIIWLAYNLCEALNPISPSILAWVYTVRTVGFIMLMYFVFTYQIRSVTFIKFLFKLWLVLAAIASISAFQQEKFGFFGFEKKWLYADAGRVSLLFIEGHMRKFAIFSDPVTFSYNMVIASLLCISLITGNLRLYKKIILGCMAFFFLYVMLFSGTRGAYVLIPAGLVMLAVLKFSKRVLIFSLIAGFFLGVLILMPTSNPLIKRFQSAFRPTKDASFNVRAENQKRIRPYILSHPIGGGLGSVGIWGRRFAPNSMLAKFPPDSGYVRVAVEMGWIGLLLFCTLMFIVLYSGINYYYLIRDPELKTYSLAMILVIFALNVGSYPQQAIVQYPTNILFYLAIAILVVCNRLDKEGRQKSAITVPDK